MRNQGVTEVTISFLTMNVRQPAIARDHIENDFTSFEFEAETELVQTCAPHRIADARFVLLAVEHQKSAAAGTADFSPNSPILFRQFLPGIDLAAADASRQSLLGLPVNIQEFAEVVKVPSHNCISNVDAYAFDFAKALDHRIAFRLGVVVLLFENLGRVPRGACVKEEHIAFEQFQSVHVQAQTRCPNPAIFPDMKRGQATERRHVLILFPNRLMQPVEFDMASFLGQPLGTGGRLSETVHGIQQPYQVTTGGTQTGPCGNICDGDDFYAILDMKVTQSLACQGVLHLVHVPHQLRPVVLNADGVVENWRIDIQVHIFVDCNCQHKAFVLAIERGQIRTSATQRCPRELS